MPPRHGKSELTSKWFPAWYLSLFPDRKVILASYSGGLAGNFGGEVRDLVNEHSAALGIGIRDDKKAAATWRVAGRRGGMTARGVRGSMTGLGANLFIIDDPVRDWMDAYSEAIRESTWDWYKSVAQTRLEPGASVVIVMTRWHDADLVGKVQQLAAQDPDADQFIEVRLPALAEENDPLGREPGEALCPERFDAPELRRKKANMGPLVWAGLYQQRPEPDGGNLFPPSAWRYYLFPPALSWFDRLLQSWDLAFEDLKTSSFVVGQVWGFKGAEAYLLDQVRARMDFVRTCDEIVRLRRQWKAAVPILVEKKANGPAVMSALRKKVPGLLPYEPRGSKEARAAAVQPFAAAGNVLLPRPDLVPWVPAFIEELRKFPSGDDDDQVDAFSQALEWQWLRDQAPTSMNMGGAVAERPDWRREIS